MIIIMSAIVVVFGFCLVCVDRGIMLLVKFW